MNAQRGFTLIEVMIVVVIIGILTAIAYPSYTEYVIRGKIPEGTSALADGRVKMEQFFQDNRTYAPLSVALTAANGCPTAVPMAATTNFTYRCDNLAATTYLITANGKTNLAAFSYTINQDNTKGSTTAWGNSATCWVVRKGGGC
jgi:type IV pilus assembly protein PilE